MENKNPTEVITDNTQTNQEDSITPEQPIKEETVEEHVQPESHTKENTIKDRLKQLSSEYKLNLFDREGVIALADTLKGYQNMSLELQEKTEVMTKEIAELKQAQEESAARYKALALGFAEDKLTEVFALASVNKNEGETIEEGLLRVKEKYGSMFTQAGPKAGLLHNDTQRAQEEKKLTEAEKYMAKNPKYQTYYGK